MLHPTAIISSEARLGDGVEVGPHAVIEGPAELGAGTRVAGHAWIRGRVSIGPGCSIGWGAVIGTDPQDLAFDPATESGVEIGPGTTIREHVTVHRATQPGGATRIGARNLLMVGCHVAHDCVIGDDCVVANNVLFAGHIVVGDRCFLSGGSVFHQFIHIGDHALVQGNAAISKDVPPFSIAHGHNRLAGLNVIGLRRAGIDPPTRAEIKRLHRLLFGSGLAITRAVGQAREHQWSEPARRLLEAAARPSRKGILTRAAEPGEER